MTVQISLNYDEAAQLYILAMKHTREQEKTFEEDPTENDLKYIESARSLENKMMNVCIALGMQNPEQFKRNILSIGLHDQQIGRISRANPAAELGAKGGASKSEAKKKSSAENGKMGGRPLGPGPKLASVNRRARHGLEV